MADTKPSSFTCNIKEFIIEEIALEGLEGIGLRSLWKRLEARISAPITDKMKTRFWSYISNCSNILFYEIPEPLPDIKIIDRLTIIDQETGYLMDPDDYLDGPYEYCPVDDNSGSSVHYKTRSLVPNDVITQSTYEKIETDYGDKLVLVASLKERWKALAPDLPISFLSQLGQLNYCLLELIGRARSNGQMTTGKTNLTKIVKDSKILFYHRKALQNLDLVRVTCVTQVTSGRAIKSLLIRLKKFHKSDILSVPKSGLIRNLVDYLHEQPNFCEKTEMVIKKGLMTPAQNKKFQKKVSIFHFEEDPLTSELIFTSTSKDSKKPFRKRYMCLLSKSDESSQSDDDEESSQPLKCQYKIGVNVLRQAYERFLEAGRNGLTQHELAELVGIEFYVGRTICRIFKSKNIIREFIECKGRQRMGRYIAIAATSKMDSKLAEEREKFQKLLNEGDKLCNKNLGTKSESSSDSETLIAKKKRKLENSETSTAELGITEVKHIEGVTNPVERKLDLETKVSLRQLKFANGILKVLHEKTFVQGYHTLSNLVATDCQEPPMDTKPMKLLLQGMVSAGHLKIYKLRVPRSQFQYSIMICAPHIKRNDPILKMKYKELLHKVSLSQKIAQKKMVNHNRPLSQYAYPRYVKVQKLHEALVKIMYFDDVKSEASDLPHGFLSIKNLIPELTVGVALGHISSEGVIDVSRFTIDDSLLNVKLRDAPPELLRVLLKSNNLQASLRCILKILAQFGLVQLIVQSTSDVTEIPDNSMTINLFYVNKHAKILDTSGIWPRKNVQTENLEREFHFDTLGAVKEYWQAVYHISTNTTIEVPNRRQKNIKIRPPIRTINQALELDNGQRFGNGMGPCGFDSVYYLDIPRLWKAYCIRSTSLKSKLKNAPVKLPKFEIPKKRKVSKKKSIKQTKVKKPEVVFQRPPIKLGDKNKKRMRNGLTWSPDEDRLLMMCKTAITIMSPISQPGCLRVRNIVAKDILSLNDPKKIQHVCHKRAAVIESNSTLMHERNCILNELRRQNVLGKYEGLLKKLRILHSTNMTKYINEARKPMMELVWILYQVSKNLHLLQEIPSLTMDYDEFHKRYAIASSANQITNIYQVPHENEVTIATLKEAILLTVMLSFENTIKKKTAEMIYSYFCKFPESELRTALEPLRKSGAIAARDKLIRTHLHVVDLDDITQSSYRISAVYQRKWITRLNSEFSDNLCNSFSSDTNQNIIKASPETNCFFFEQLAIDTLDTVTVTVPVISGPSGSIIQEEQLNVIDIATNFKLKSGTIGWKNKAELDSYTNLYKDINVKDAFEFVSRQLFIPEDNLKENTDENHVIVNYLRTKQEKGATFKELLESLKMDRKTLIEDLSELQAKNVIKRVGFQENIAVLVKYVNQWCMAIPGGYIIAVPWLTLDAQIRHNIFYQWAGVIMNKIFENPGCSISYMLDACEFLSVRAAQDICELLLKCECITLHTLLSKEIGLFSEDDDVTSDLCEYNEFEAPENIIAVPTNDCLSKYSYLRNIILTGESAKPIGIKKP